MTESCITLLHRVKLILFETLFWCEWSNEQRRSEKSKRLDELSKKLDELAEAVEIEETLSRIESSSGKKVYWSCDVCNLCS